MGSGLFYRHRLFKRLRCCRARVQGVYMLRVEGHPCDSCVPNTGLNLALIQFSTHHLNLSNEMGGMILILWVLPAAESFHFLLEWDVKGPNLKSHGAACSDGSWAALTVTLGETRLRWESRMEGGLCTPGASDEVPHCQGPPLHRPGALAQSRAVP